MGDDGLDPLSSSQAPLGTRDANPSRRAETRIESPGARNRTPQPLPPPPPIAGDAAPRAARASRPPRTSTAERPEERIGQVLGSYRLLELLGKGGMGFVYRAEHVKLGRPVALKLLRADYAKRRDSVARFFQEARTVNRVRHRNIVDVTDFVELEDGSGTTFIIMELLEGESFGRWAKRGFSTPRALALLVQICDGLAAAHAVGVIHRDLKPDNVIVVPTGDGAEIVKLLDFGVAKLLNRDDEDIGLETQAGSVIGTPAYMSPEQAGGTTVDFRSDIYSLGAIMYELFCGQPMFKGRSFGEFVRKHLNELPVPPRQTPGGKGLDDRIEAVILRCIEKEPIRRYASLGELRDDLLHLLGGIETAVGGVRELAHTDSLRSSDLIPMSSRRVAHAPTPAPLPTAEAREPSAFPWKWVAVGGIVLGATALAILIASSGQGPRSTPRNAAAPQPPPAAEPKPQPQPEVTPLGEPAKTVEPAATVIVKLFTEPEGDVYEAGSSQRRCHTPCSLEIIPSDGGSTTHRDFVVRASGYHEAPVTVDLTKPPGELHVTLEKRAADKPEPKPEPPRPPPKVEEPKVEEPEPEPPKVEDPPPKKPPKKIDPSDTVDPFSH